VENRTFEYMHIYGRLSDPDGLNIAMTEMGRGGWELVSVVPFNQNTHLLYWKRERPA
jgi:hypothetical protein